MLEVWTPCSLVYTQPHLWSPMHGSLSSFQCLELISVFPQAVKKLLPACPPPPAQFPIHNHELNLGSRTLRLAQHRFCTWHLGDRHCAKRFIKLIFFAFRMNLVSIESLC